MWKILFLVFLFKQSFHTAKTENLLPPSIVEIIKTHFREREETNLMFCQKKDAMMVLKRSLNEARSYNVNLLNRPTMPKILKITFMTPQIIGIFLDLSCNEGKYFLKELDHAGSPYAVASLARPLTAAVYGKTGCHCWERPGPAGVVMVRSDSYQFLMHEMMKMQYAKFKMLHRRSEVNSDSFNASFRWLIWTKDPLTTTQLLNPTRFMTDSDVTLAYPNGTDIILQDIYRMHDTLPVIATEIQRWSEEGTVTDLAVPPPREDFQGITLTGSLLMVDTVINKTEEIPLLFDPSYLPKVDANRRYGFTLFTHMAEYYNYRYRYIYSDVWGYPLKNGSWSGMVGQVKRREADMGLSAVHFSIARTNVADFVGIIDITRVCYAFLQPKLFGSYKALILPLDVTVWACLLVITVAGIVVFRIVAAYDDTSQHNDSWGGSILLVLAAISQQGIPDSTEKLPTRLIYLSLLGVSFLAAVYYNTSILNGLLLPAPNAIQTMDQLLASDLKIATSDTKYLLYDLTRNDSLTVKLRKKMEKSKLPNGGVLTVSGGVDMVKKGGLALYILTRETYQEINYKFTAAEICSLTEIEKYRPLPTGGIVPNNSPFREIFNRKFTLMRETGIMYRGKLLWNPRKPECNWKQDALVIGTEPLSMAYVVLFLGMIASTVVVILELHTARKQKKIAKRNHSSKFFTKKQLY